MNNIPPEIAMAMQMGSVLRENTFLNSNQISLGKFLDELKNAAENARDDAHVVYDFGDIIPNGFDSYRGSYEELALGYIDWRENRETAYNSVMLSDFVSETESCLEKTFLGYKGGHYRMTENTPLWCANYGHSGHTYVSGVQLVEDGRMLVIHTCYGEF